MTLQNTALNVPPEGGDDWALANEPPQGGALDTVQQNEGLDPPNDDNQQAPINQPPASLTLEQLGEKMGWTPLEKWRGDPNKHVGVEEYLLNMPRVLERTKHDLKTYRSTAQSLEQRLASLEQGYQTAQQREAQSLNAQYEDAKFNAAKAGNEELYAKLVKEQAEVMAQYKPSDRLQAQQQTQPQVDVYEQAERIMQDPVAARFFEANPIALNDERAWELMDREMTIVAQRGGTPAQQFQAAEAALRYAYAGAYEAPAQAHHSQTQPREHGRFASPNQQQQQPRRPAPPMAPATRTVTQQPQTAVDRLPAEAKAHLEKEAAAGKVPDKEQWAKAFLGEKITVRGRAPNEQRQGS